MEPENVKRWYAILVKSRRENVVAEHLRARGFETFLPLYRVRRRWSDRFKDIDLPLFPSYVFCQFDPLNRLPVVSIPGIVHVVGTGRTPIAIDSFEIAAIQTVVKSELPRQPWPFLEIGQRVRIECGPLLGLEGVLLDFRGHQRLVLSVTLLQRSVAVQIEGSWVRALPQKPSVPNRLVTSQRVLPQPTPWTCPSISGRQQPPEGSLEEGHK